VFLLPTRTIILCELLGSCIAPVIGSAHLAQQPQNIDNESEADVEAQVEVDSLSEEDKNDDDIILGPVYRFNSNGDLISHILHARQDVCSSALPRSLSDPYLCAITGEESGIVEEKKDRDDLSREEIVAGDYQTNPVNEKLPPKRSIEVESLDIGVWGIEASWREWRNAKLTSSSASPATSSPQYYIDDSEHDGEAKEERNREWIQYLSLTDAQLSAQFDSLDTVDGNKFLVLAAPTMSTDPEELAPPSSPVDPDDSVVVKFKLTTTCAIVLVTIIPAWTIPGVSSVWTVIGSVITPGKFII